MTRIIDTIRGVPAARIGVELDIFVSAHGWNEVGHGATDANGRITEFGEARVAGIYRLMFDVASYSPDTLFPSIVVTFEIPDPSEDYNIGLLLSRTGYSVFRDPWR